MQSIVVPLEGSTSSGRALPLSARQSLFWLDEQLFPDARYYNTALTVVLDGALDADRLVHAFAQTVLDLDALRIAVDPVSPVPRWSEGEPRPLEVLPITEGEVKAWVAARTALPLGKGGRPLWDAALLRVSAERHILCVCLHHLIADGLSAMLLVEHLAERYAGRTPAPAASFRDYLEAEARYRVSDRAAKDAAYWERKLAGGSPPIRPYGITRTDTSVALARERRELAVEHASRLASLALQAPFDTLTAPLSRFVVLATGVAAALYRVSGDREVLLGVPFGNRSGPFARTFGLLMEQLFLKVDIEEGDTFQTLATRVRAELLKALRHGQSCVGERGVHYVTLNLLPHPPTRFADLEASVSLDPLFSLPESAVGHGDLRNTLGIQAFDFDEGPLHLKLDFHAATFEPRTRRRLQKHLLRMLEALAASPGARLDSVELVDEEERAVALAVADGRYLPDVPPDVVEQLRMQARRRPDHVAVSSAQATLTYAQLEVLTDRLAGRLRSLGVVPESRVGVAVPRGAHELVALLGTLKAGGAYVPVDPSHPVERVQVILEDAAPEVFIAPASSPLGPALPATTQWLKLDDLADATERFEPLPPGERAHPDQLAYILFTSGSTGRPKGVEVLRGAFSNFLLSMAHAPGLSEHERLLAVTTTTFDIAGLELFLPLWVGGTVVIADRETAADPSRLRARLEAESFSVMQATPTAWRLLVDAGWKGSAGLRMFCGGEPLNPDLAATLLERGSELWNLYGPTETTVWSTLERVVPGARVTIGRPIDRTRLYVLNPS
ncbi:MAG: AMP-binding protein, partial [Myxococcaceae bacterium]|nr:AMP-binding protein [Myxococcaceae bacterium]